jgi:hypothetical protein
MGNRVSSLGVQRGMKQLPKLALAAAALFVGGALCAAGCASGSSGGDASGQPVKATVAMVGTFRIQGGPAPGINRPLSGTITIHAGSATGKVVDTVTATSGHFHATVAPGRYVLVGTTAHLTGAMCTTDATAIAGHTVHVGVNCDVP